MVTENERVVREFIEAWSRLDPKELAAYFCDDGVYHNMPMQPVAGRQNVINFVTDVVLAARGVLIKKCADW